MPAAVFLKHGSKHEHSDVFGNSSWTAAYELVVICVVQLKGGVSKERVVEPLAVWRLWDVGVPFLFECW